MRGADRFAPLPISGFKRMTDSLKIEAKPFPIHLNPIQCALLVIDMQRDFLEPGGFGASLGNDVGLLRSAIEPIRHVLELWRSERLPVFHTREGHLPDLSDLPPAKRSRGDSERKIGDLGPMGRLLIRGEPGHEIIPELSPLPSETVIDKPGKGAFWATDLQKRLVAQCIQQIVIVGVTTEVCVHTTLREANDRGYDCLVLSDATASYFPEFHQSALSMVTAQGGLFGWVSNSAKLMAAFPRSAKLA